MWTSNRKTEGRTVEAAADLGLVTLGGDPAGVYLGGERRWVAVCAPGGYQWRPQTGDKVLVVKAGDQREIPCLAGVRQPEIQETALKGRVTVNGERLEDMIWRIAADVVSSMLG